MHQDGRGLAALVHFGTMVLFGPLFPLGLALALVAGLDRRPLVRQAAHASRWFDLTTVGLLAFGVWLLAADISVDVGAAVLIVAATTFVVAHLLGVVAALRGREFRYPSPRRRRR